LKNEGLLDKYIVIAQNGSPVGLPLVKNGELAYTISTSPGWQGLVSVLALYQNIKGDSKEVNQAIVLPNIPVTQDVATDKKKVVPWECDPVWIDLTKQYYPKLGAYLPDAANAPKP
jgi:ribose transport system substrate-binding protein